MTLKYREEKIITTLDELKKRKTLSSENQEGFSYIPTGYKENNPPPKANGTWKKLAYGDRLPGDREHFWLFGKIKTPCQTKNNTKVFFNLKTGREGLWDMTNPQAICYINGHAATGMDVNHTDLELDFDHEYDIHIYLYSGEVTEGIAFYPSISVTDTSVEQLFYDISVPFEAYKCMEKESEAAVIILKYLEKACNKIDISNACSEDFYASIQNATDYLYEEFYNKVCGHSASTVSCVGHTHIDVAWMWPLIQTKEKAQRSFSSMMNLMDSYEDFIFMSSQPQLYQFVKDNDPEIYAKIKEYIKQGRWEAEGAMWLEADCNLSSGESLIRQIVLGKKFFKDEFNVESHILWLPDVFGYSAALPQIMKKTGIDRFVTSKISWNDTNKLPYDVFMWEGLDGSEVFTVFMTAQELQKVKSGSHYTVYCGKLNPSQVLGARLRFQQKEYSDKALLTFGYGDGGGGATREMLENHKRLKYGLPGMPKTVIEKASVFLDKLEDDFITSAKELKNMPKWCGELYLEYHRGTYTSMAKNKRNNRFSEFLYLTVEQLSCANAILSNTAYPSKKLADGWRLILLNQFHDILPGSSIKEVYEDSDKDYAEIKKNGNQMLSSALFSLGNAISSSGEYVYNPNSFYASGTVKVGGRTVFVNAVPPMGYKKLSSYSFKNTISVGSTFIESPYYSIKFNSNGDIVSIYDKEFMRDVTDCGKIANELEAFEDLPYIYENWEIAPYYKQKKYTMPPAEKTECISDGVKSGLKIIRKFKSSTITQYIYVYENNRRIDFETEVDWHESHILLKAAFPLNVHSDKASFETQFGYLERPTHKNSPFDYAKFEVCAHKYADISEDDFGVAVLNDCKYGYSTERNTLKLTLIKCGTIPFENADKEFHRFTYSLFPHGGNHRQGGVIQESYLLNRPLFTFTSNGGGQLPESFSLVKCDKENIITETFKLSNDEKGFIMRSYDAYSRKTKATFSFGFDFKNAYICDMLENKQEKININNNREITVEFKNFEIVTVYLEV